MKDTLSNAKKSFELKISQNCSNVRFSSFEVLHFFYYDLSCCWLITLNLYKMLLKLLLRFTLPVLAVLAKFWLILLFSSSCLALWITSSDLLLKLGTSSSIMAFTSCTLIFKNLTWAYTSLLFTFLAGTMRPLGLTIMFW